jgi:hypothetical protein
MPPGAAESADIGFHFGFVNPGLDDLLWFGSLPRATEPLRGGRVRGHRVDSNGAAPINLVYPPPAAPTSPAAVSPRG